MRLGSSKRQAKDISSQLRLRVFNIVALAILYAGFFLGGGLAVAPVSLAAAEGATLPSDTVLYLRLQTKVSTKACKAGDAVTATIAREVGVQGKVAIPIGAVVKGSVEKCTQPSAPNERAELLLKFTGLVSPGSKEQTLKGHVSGVENARESVQPDGTIVGVAASDTPATLLSGVLQRLGSLDPSISDEIRKQRIGEVNTAIEYPAGTDLQFTLTQPLTVARLLSPATSEQLPSNLKDSLVKFLADAPQRSSGKDSKPGDPVNIIIIGAAQDIQEAFHQAAWTEPKLKSADSILGTVRAVINEEGYAAAPISDLYLYGRKQDAAFERLLNTFNQRHHLRLWQTSQSSPDGRPIWLAAATHDTGIDIHPGVVSHAIDPSLDDEREQVRSDLVACGAVQAAGLLTPPHPLTSGLTATGGDWKTDGRLAVIELKPAAAPTSAP